MTPAIEATTPILSATALTKTFRTGGTETPALRGVDLKIESGDMVVTVMNPTGRIHSGALWIGYFLATQGERANVPKFIRIDGGIVNKDNAPGYLWLGEHLLI